MKIIKEGPIGVITAPWYVSDTGISKGDVVGNYWGFYAADDPTLFKDDPVLDFNRLWGTPVVIDGIVEIDKASPSEVYALGDMVWCDADGNAAIADASIGVGICVYPSGNGDPTVQVLLGGKRYANV